MTDVSPLFRPFKLRGMELKNRIAMAPMTRGHSPGGIPTPENAAYYRRRAAAEVGLIISEGTLTRRKGAADNAAYPLFWGEEALAGWKRTIDGVHAAGGKMAPQIWHLGMSRKPGTGHFPDAPCDGPSGITLTGKKISEEPSEAEVIDMAQAYADAAADAKRLGFDCIELHGAHAYLIDEFFWPVTNQRTDRFGGASIEQRSEFAREVITRCRAVIGDLPMIIRISQWKSVDYNARIATSPKETRSLGPRPRRRRRRCDPLFAAPHPRTGIPRHRWSQWLELRGLGQEAHRHPHHQRRLGRPVLGIHRLLPRRRLGSRQAR
jgi:2,4-dienoyl-CoA reductase-like NADH-dependent reductase (Old Yellow Enzyme family)